jgi:hypothetical protein
MSTRQSHVRTLQKPPDYWTITTALSSSGCTDLEIAGPDTRCHIDEQLGLLEEGWNFQGDRGPRYRMSHGRTNWIIRRRADLTVWNKKEKAVVELGI